MDEVCSRAVTEVFVRLYEKGLIYRGKYMVNFCPGCRTVISDIEVNHEDTNGYLYYIKYPLLGEGDLPETLAGASQGASETNGVNGAHGAPRTRPCVPLNLHLTQERLPAIIHNSSQLPPQGLRQCWATRL